MQIAQNDSQICVSVNMRNGYFTGLFLVVVFDAKGKKIYEHTVFDVKHSTENIAKYINKHFVNSDRFKNLVAVYYAESDVFEYYGVDLKRLKEALRENEKWENIGLECPWYESPWNEDIIKTEQTKIDFLV